MENPEKKAEIGANERLSALLIRCGQKLASSGTHQTQGRILKLLYLYGPMTQKALQDKLAIRPGSMSEIAAKLERKGLLLREKDPADKRRVFLSLTPAGRADVEQFRARRGAEHAMRFEALSPEQRAQLGALLEKLLDSWESPGRESSG